MANNEGRINGALERIARGYTRAKADWKADRRNLFKDGKFLAYYEAREAIVRCLDADGAVGSAFEEIRRRYAQAKEDWKRDRRNPFKDGRFLAYFEMLRAIPAAQ